MDQIISVKGLANALLYSVVGLIVLAVSFEVIDKLTPGNIWKEIFEEQNVALAITMGAFTISMAQIIGAAIHQ
jgi:putative membrane protein